MIARISLLCLAAWAFPAASAQTLRVLAQFGGIASTVNEGGTLQISSDESLGGVSLINASSAPVAINQVAVSGSEFTISNLPPLPVTLPPGASTSLGIRYVPVAGKVSTGQVSVGYTESNQSRSYSFNLLGAAPEFLYFLVGADGTRVPIAPGATISFPPTRPGSSATLTMIIRNQGAVAGTVRSVTMGGRDFFTSLLGPVVIPGGQEIAIPLTFAPQAREARSGTLSVNFSNGAAAFTVVGTGATPEFVMAYALRTDGNVRPLTNNGRLTFAQTPALTTTTADVIVANQGNAPGRVRSISLSGNGLQLTNLPLLPATLAAGEVLRFQIQFSPRQLGSYTGALQIETDDGVVNVTVEGATSNPDFVLFYLDPESRSVLRLPEGGTLSFASTPVDSNVTYTLVLQNQGPGTGTINSIAVTGEGFQLVDLPSLPANIEPGRDLRFGVRFAPAERKPHVGSLRIEVSTGTISATLSGAGIGPEFNVSVTEGDGSATPVPNGSEIAFRAPVGQSTSRTLVITNQGNATAQLTSISVSGSGFQLTNVPFLPVAIPVNDSQVFNVTFTPAQPGVARGRLRIGNAAFDLVGTGLAARLEFSYTNDAGQTNVAEGGTVILTPTAVGESSRVEFAVVNTGNLPFALSTIDVSSPSGAFVVEDGPELPLSLAAGDGTRFRIRFAPNNTGAAVASLRVNNTTFTLTGNGRDPAPLPGYNLQGPSGVQTPLEQPSVGLSLENPYSLPIRGILNLSFVSEVFTDDPAVQFSTGGRSAAFTIPANTTRAIFDNGATQVKLQAGTVAGTIQLRPTFSTQAGLSLPVANPVELTAAISRSAPRLLSGEVSARTPTAIVIIVTGYSTTRSLRRLDIDLSPVSGQTFTATRLSINVESAAIVWFQSTQAQSLGGLFSLAIPLTFQRGNATEDLIRYLQSVRVTVANEVGASNAIEIFP